MKIKTIIAILAVFVLLTGLAAAHGDEVQEGKELIDQKVDCADLSSQQLAAIGDYYMEQMHPGEAHERMDEMMGGEGSESLEEMHIAMAQRFYCGESTSYGMMGGGMMMNGGMMGGYGNMMGNYNGMMNSGWAGNYGQLWNLISPLTTLLLVAGLIILIVLLFVKKPKDPRDILRMRYVKGEISKKEYESIKKEL